MASIAQAALLAALDHNTNVETEDDRRIALTVNTNITHRKRGVRLTIAGNASVAKEPDPSLVALITKAHQARTDLLLRAATATSTDWPASPISRPILQQPFLTVLSPPHSPAASCSNFLRYQLAGPSSESCWALGDRPQLGGQKNCQQRRCDLLT